MSGKQLYDVVFSERQRQQLKSFAEQAERLGRKKAFAQRLMEIHEALANDPVSFGDPRRRFDSIELTEYVAMRGPFLIGYGVHATKFKVLIKSLQYFPEYDK
jgi:hypothetical protein